MHSQATLDRVLDLHEQGATILAISKDTGVCRNTVIAIIKQRVRMSRVAEQKNVPRKAPYTWCPHCRAKVQMPCIACRTRKATKHKEDMAWLRSYIEEQKEVS